MKAPKKISELDRVLRLISSGLTKDKIRKKLNLKSTALANRLRRLADLGNIELKGKYIMKVLRTSLHNPEVTKNQVHKKLNKRGHAYNVSVFFPNEEDLRIKKKVINEFKLKKLGKLPFGSYSLKKDKNTIWINKNSLTIYSSNSYYSKNALHSKFRALKDIDNLIQYLKGRFGFKGIYGIEIFREHYGLIFNKFAKWILGKGKKLYVKEKGNKTILWVDNSRKDDVGLEEFEGSDPIKINKADDFFESKDKTGWRDETPEVKKNKKEIANLKGVFPAMKEYNKNLKLHTEVQEEQLKTQKEMQQLLFKLNSKL